MTSGVAADHEEQVAALLTAALGLRDASLVIYRPGVLVEFKTDRLTEKVTSFEEQGFRSWQIGAFEDHHCHLNLREVIAVEFDAEPVGCQGGRLNYTVWFSGAGDGGNPFRPTGRFSVTLNAPYTDDGMPKPGIVDQVYDLHDRLAASPLVRASEAFLAARPAPA